MCSASSHDGKLGGSTTATSIEALFLKHGDGPRVGIVQGVRTMLRSASRRTVQDLPLEHELGLSDLDYRGDGSIVIERLKKPIDPSYAADRVQRFPSSRTASSERSTTPTSNSKRRPCCCMATGPTPWASSRACAPCWSACRWRSGRPLAWSEARSARAGFGAMAANTNSRHVP